MRAHALLLSLCLSVLPLAGHAAERAIYGLNEKVAIPEFDLEIAAKLDTGAQTASLSARDIQRFKKNGEPWVRFYLAFDTEHSHPIERPLVRVSKIKRRAGDFDPEEEKTYTARPVIELDLCMGKVKRSIEMNLTDRSAFQYPILIGSDALTRFGALVDPSRTYIAGKPGCTNESDADE
ncbi:ATP-dependent zinc protease family protein [Pseudomonas oligotrophica]|uniref:retropepsin-like aspartic peptidase RloA n=1 Tax=Pseudomonas oligotrophica TaxID=2912055 RepID=UPI001F3B8452|nr:ATP-dependent zinc protease [Pseudomonas oligotrophica]MCF7202313.1 ATP-dependent zinc protease [Pseudomonas oligotrophica]